MKKRISKINRDLVKQVFKEYTDGYDSSDGKIALKIKHTYYVAELCEKIAKSLSMSVEEVDLAWLCGMLHDVGRFEQLRRFGTFVDAKSIDHAKFAVEILFGEEQRIWDYLPDWNKEQDREVLETIHKAIGNHSAFRVEEGLSDWTMRFCDIVRDADKIDIFRVSYETPLEVIYNVSEEEIKKQAVTDIVMKSFMEHRAVIRSDKKTVVDSIVGHAALAFELVFPESRVLAKKQGYLEKILQYSSENEQTRKNFEVLRKEMQEFLSV